MKSRFAGFALGLMATVLASHAQTFGTFAATGSMNVARFGAAAALLPDGQVLVAGGNQGVSGPALDTAELYNPSTGTWTKTGNLRSASGSGLSMMLLQTGEVLVTGGFDSTGNGTAELYDPASGKFALTGSISDVAGGSVVLLANGQVLMAGGTDAAGTVVRTAELYTPATGTWTKTGDMTTPRADARAVLLQTGQVLVAGGINSNGNLDTAELYDPASGKWTETGSMPTTLVNFTATLLQNGKVLVVEGAPSGSALYDPASGQWSAISFTLGSSRTDVVATLLSSGKVLFTGGIAYSPRPTHTLANATLYDPATGGAEGAGAMLISRYGQSATLLENGQVLVAGGDELTTTARAVLTEAELYTP